MTGSIVIHILLSVIFFSAFAFLLFFAFRWPVTYALGCVGILSDKDPNNNKCEGLNSTNWTHGYICEKCMSFTCHDEHMTKICLSCGGRFDWCKGSVSTRLIIIKGRWARQIKWNGKNYINNKAID